MQHRRARMGWSRETAERQSRVVAATKAARAQNSRDLNVRTSTEIANNRCASSEAHSTQPRQSDQSRRPWPGSSNSDPMRTVRSSMTALASSLTAQFHACGVLTALLRRGHRQPALPQRPVQPLRQRACFQPDPLHSHTERFDTAIRATGSLGTFTSRTILPLSSTTHTLELFRDTSISCIMLHGRPSMMLGARASPDFVKCHHQ